MLMRKRPSDIWRESQTVSSKRQKLSPSPPDLDGEPQLPSIPTSPLRRNFEQALSLSINIEATRSRSSLLPPRFPLSPAPPRSPGSRTSTFRFTDAQADALTLVLRTPSPRSSPEPNVNSPAKKRKVKDSTIPELPEPVIEPSAEWGRQAAQCLREVCEAEAPDSTRPLLMETDMARALLAYISELEETKAATDKVIEDAIRGFKRMSTEDEGVDVQSQSWRGSMSQSPGMNSQRWSGSQNSFPGLRLSGSQSPGPGFERRQSSNWARSEVEVEKETEELSKAIKIRLKTAMTWKASCKKGKGSPFLIGGVTDAQLMANLLGLPEAKDFDFKARTFARVVFEKDILRDKKFRIPLGPWRGKLRVTSDVTLDWDHETGAYKWRGYYGKG